MAKTIKTFCFKDSREWREWLSANHNSCNELWLQYFKKHTGKPTVSYEEAVEEAICYGWIDSTVRTIDDISYCQKFTPRRAGSKWSPTNIRRARRLVDSGRMTEAGMAKYSEALDNPSLLLAETPKPESVKAPEDLLIALKRKGKAYEIFMGYSSSYRSMAIRWVLSAKREETRTKRIKEITDMSARDEKIGLK